MAVNEKNLKEMIDTRVGALTNAASETGDVIASVRFLQAATAKGTGTAVAANKSLVDAIGFDGASHLGTGLDSDVASLKRAAITASPVAKSVEAYVGHRVAPTYLTLPSLAVGTAIPTNAGAWTYGAYQEVVAANGIAVAYWIVGLSITSPNPDLYQIDMATGGAGAEVSAAVLNLQLSSAVVAWLPVPIPVAANVRFAVRGASSLGNQNPGFRAALIYATGL